MLLGRRVLPGRRVRPVPVPRRGLEQLRDLHAADEPRHAVDAAPERAVVHPPPVRPRDGAVPQLPARSPGAAGEGAGAGADSGAAGRGRGTARRRPLSRSAFRGSASRCTGTAVGGGSDGRGAPLVPPAASTMSSGLPSRSRMRRTAAGTVHGGPGAVPVDLVAQLGDQPHAGGRRQLPLLGHVADTAQVLVDDLVALDPHGALRGGVLWYAVGRRYRILPGAADAHRATHAHPPSYPPANVGRMSTEEKSAAPRSLAEALRVRTTSRWPPLLRSRPDLITPVPTDLTQLATRAGTRASVVRALERLDRFTLQTAEALAVAADPAPYDELLRLMAGDERDPVVAAALPRAVALLRATGPGVGARTTGCGWCAPPVSCSRPPRSTPLRRGSGPCGEEATAGMSPGRIQEILAAVGLPSTHDSVSAVSALGELFTDRQRMAGLLAGLPEESRGCWDRLVWGAAVRPGHPRSGGAPAPPAGQRPAACCRPRPARSSCPARSPLHLRAGRAHRTPEPVPPPVEAPPRTVHRLWTPPRPGAGPVGAGDRRGAAEGVGRGRPGGAAGRRAERARPGSGRPSHWTCQSRVAAFWVELAYAAGLIASDGEADERYAATPAYDEWRGCPPRSAGRGSPGRG